jgi:hypothetical protein
MATPASPAAAGIGPRPLEAATLCEAFQIAYLFSNAENREVRGRDRGALSLTPGTD